MSVLDNVAFGLRGAVTRTVKQQGAGGARPGRARPRSRGKQAAASSPVACSSASRWPGRSSTGPTSCCSTSRSARSTSSCAAQMQIELKRIQQEVGLTFIHVTHDQEEAMTMADTIAVMNAGRLEQIGDPADPLRAPARRPSSRTSSASRTCCAATVTGQADGGLLRADVHGARGRSSTPRERARGRHRRVGRASAPRSCDPRASDGRAATSLRGVVTDVSFTGVATQYLVRMPWGFDVVVVQQNDGSAARPARRDTSRCRGTRGREFVLDAAQDATSPAWTRCSSMAVRSPALAGPGRPPRPPPSGRNWVPYALLRCPA